MRSSSTLRFWFCSAVLFALTGGLAHAQFTPGNLVVLRIGNGTDAITGNTSSIQDTLLQFDTAGNPVGTPLSIPSTGSGAYTNTANAATEGVLTRSVDSQYLLFGAYNAPAGTVTIATSSAATNQRAIVRVDAAANIVATNLGTTAFSGGNIRGAASTNGTDLWASGTSSGTSGGTWYTPVGGTAAQVSNTQNNQRNVIVQNNTLYYSTGSATGGAVGIQSLGSPPPTSGPVAPTAVITGVTGQGTNPQGFVFSPGPLAAGSFAYVADTTIGIQRFNFNGSAWSLAYNITASGNGISSLAVDFSGANPVLFAVQPANLLTFTDAGAGGVMTAIGAGAGTNFVYRGVAFAPVPEPASVLGVCGAGFAAVAWLRRRAGRTADPVA
jgi:hypothetical protein